MMEKRCPPKIYAETRESEKRGAPDFHGVPPIEVIAIHADEGEAHHKASPKHRPDPVDAEQRYEHRSAYRFHKYHHHYHHQGKQSDHYPVHAFPLGEKRRVYGGYPAELDNAVNYYIDVAKEYRHIPDWRQPKLNSGIAGEGCLHPEPPGYKTCDNQKWDTGSMGAYHVCGNQDNAGNKQLRPG